MLYYAMHLFRCTAVRRLLTFVLTFALAVSLAEEGIADVHDGDATHSEIDRATGVTHASHPDRPSAAHTLDQGESSIPESPDHPVHVCHCTHVHLAVVTVPTSELDTVEHSEPALPAREDTLPIVALDRWTPPPIV